MGEELSSVMASDSGAVVAVEVAFAAEDEGGKRDIELTDCARKDVRVFTRLRIQRPRRLTLSMVGSRS